MPLCASKLLAAKRLHAVLRAAAVVVIAVSASARAEEALIAVAANFTEAAAALARDFETESGHRVELVAGSTGKLYAQIINGAPFDAFLAADQARPEKLASGEHGVAGSCFTYARGRLVLWRPGMEAVVTLDEAQASILLDGVKRLAMANPDLAPYGAAAWQVLDRLNLADAMSRHIVRGENVAHAYAMVASGAAEAGLVALTHVLARNEATSWYEIPQDWHMPINQDAILLVRGLDNAAARGFLDYLRTEAARRRIAELGFHVD